MESKKRDEQKEKKRELKSHELFKLPIQDGRVSSDSGHEAFIKPTLYIPSVISDRIITPCSLAVQHMLSRKYFEAIKLLSRITHDCDQDHLNVYLAFYYLSLCYSALGDFLEARRFIDKAIAILLLEIPEFERQDDIHRMKSFCFYQRAITHYHISKQYLVDSDIERHDKEIYIAGHYLKQATAEASADHKAHNSYPLFQKLQKEFDEGVIPEVKEHFQCDFSSLNLHYASAYPAVGPLYINEGNAEQALEYFNQAITNQPANGAHYQNRGLAYQFLGRLDEAREDFEKSIKLDPDKCRYKISVAMNLLYRRDDEKAVAYLEELRAKYPSNITILINLSTAYGAVKDHPKSIEFSKKVLEKLPTSWPCLFSLVNAYYALKDYENTLSTLDKIMDNSRFKESAILRYEIYVKLALIMTRLNFFDEAINIFKKAYELCSSDTDKARIDFELGNLCFDNCNYPEAIPHYQKANNVLKADIIQQCLTEAEEMIKNPDAIPAARYHIDISIATPLPKEFKNELEDWAEFKLFRARCSDDITYSQRLKPYPLLYDNGDSKPGAKIYRLYKGYQEGEEKDCWYQYGTYKHASRKSKLAVTGHYTYVVVDRGPGNPPLITIGTVGHFYLAKGEEVLFAGEIVIKDGKIGLWDNASGHFKPKEHSAAAVAKLTGFPLEKFFPYEKITDLLKGLFEKYKTIEGVAKSHGMRNLAFGDVNLVGRVHYFHT